MPHKLKKILKKKGHNFTNIVDNWTKMVGNEISKSCYPNQVKIGKEMNNGTLVLSVVHGKETEIEYSKKEIIDKINSFFGYNYLENIKIETIHKERVAKNIYIQSKKKNKHFKKLENVKDVELKNSLNNLIEAFNAKNN